LAADHDATANAGSQYDAKDGLGNLSAAINRFRQRKTVRVVGEAYVTLQ
jgi:hypothetical protein